MNPNKDETGISDDRDRAIKNGDTVLLEGLKLKVAWSVEIGAWVLLDGNTIFCLLSEGIREGGIVDV